MLLSTCAVIAGLYLICIQRCRLKGQAFTEGPVMIPNHVDGSKNQVEVTSKIYVILESGIKLPLDSILPVNFSTRP